VRPVWSIKDARLRLERLLGETPSPSEWLAFERCMQELASAHENGRTVLASSFGATLEMAREGQIELRQEGPFEPIYMRPRRSDTSQPDAGQPDAEWQLVR
jgi:segregation and condensation protein A